MKNISINNFLGKVIGIGFCIFFFTGNTSLCAQDDVTEDTSEEVQVVKKPVHKQQLPVYEMKEVSGRILDAATKNPISGVRVQALADARYSTMTEEDGRYKLSVPVFTTALFISTPEYNSVQLPIKGGEQIVNMYSSVFHSFYKDGNTIFTNKDVSISDPSSVTAESEIENLLEGNVRTMSRGGMPGLGANMMINGITSLNAVNQPLVVVDGVIWDMQYDRTSLHQGFLNNVLNTIDVEDIENIKVLNTGTSIYGAKGANGVIEITTKRGRNRATRIQARIYGGFETNPSTIDVMNGPQFRNYISDILGTYEPSNGSDVSTALRNISNQGFLNEDPNYTFYDLYHNNTDWQKDLYKTSFTQNYKVNVQGGDDVALYGLSLGYTQANATAKKNDFSRLNIRFNTDINLFTNVFASFDIAYSKVSYNLRDNGWASDYSTSNISSPNVLGLISAPMIHKYSHVIYWDEAANMNRIFPSNNVYSGKNYSASDPLYPFNYGVNYGTEALANPYWILLNGQGDNKNYQDQTQFMLNFNPRYEFHKNWTVGDRFSYAMNRTSEMYYLPKDGTPSKFVEGLGNITSAIKSQFGSESSITNNLYLNFKKQFAAHSLNAYAGFRLSSFDYANTYARGYNNSNDKMPNLSYSLQYLSYGGTNDKWLNLAYYVDAAYNYKNCYFLNGTVTAESSSRFGKKTEEGIKMFGVNWGLFPSLQGAWLISSEPWFKSNMVNYLKLSAGYEESGNDNIDYYASRTYFANEKFFDRATSLRLANIANSSIQWETTRRFNVALETNVFDNRLNLGVNVYRSVTSNLLAKENLNYVAGLPTMWVNNGELRNVGVNVNVNAIVLNTKKFHWEAGFSIGHYDNEITKLPTSELVYYNLDANGNRNGVYRTVKGYTTSIYGDNNVLTSVGKAAGVFYGFKTAGVFTTDAEASTAGQYGYLRYPTGYAGDPYRNFKAGDVHFIDQNGDGWISDADLVQIGDPNPDIFGNIFTKFNLKNWTLDVIFKYSLGNDVFNYQRSRLEQENNLWNQSTAVCNRWSYDGHVTDMPRAVLPSSSEWIDNERFSDRWIEDGSFLKMKKVRLTFDLPVSLSWLQGVRVWGEANNLFTLTKYHGSDPEVSASNNILYQGIDTGMLHTSRSFNFGVTINL
ncbi:MAG: SusC/RagA family TonB-linked outer membrane protein [Bacteroidaceae bacterium]|nr:SusC/RagA family TonB-linked outer membrane protein [Bacteroidaceae bacterium]